MNEVKYKHTQKNALRRRVFNLGNQSARIFTDF